VGEGGGEESRKFARTRKRLIRVATFAISAACRINKPAAEFSEFAGRKDIGSGYPPNYVNLK